jgi:soluble lytic murein transglycosylase-like protein
MSSSHRRTVLAVVALTAGLLLPSTATSANPQSLPQLRDQLSEAELQLRTTEAALQRAETAINDAVHRVERAMQHLDTIEGQLAEAESARAHAAAEERIATAEAAEANGVLESRITEHLDTRARLETRAIHMYKHGPVLPEAALLRGLTASSDWHEVAVTMEAVSRVVAQERDLVATTAEQTRQVVVERASVVEARHLAVTAVRRTLAEEQRVARLVELQRQAVDRLEEERATQAEVLAELERDAEVRTALVTRLTQQLADLELDASRVLVPAELNLDLDRPPPEWIGRLPAAGRSWAIPIDAVAANRGIDGRLLAAVVWTESNFQPTVVSHAGAIGLAQLMPGTAAGLRVDPWDPIPNLDGGARYLRTQLERFGSLDLALAAYNAGPNRVQSAGPGIPNIVETQLYVVRVIERYEELSAG